MTRTTAGHEELYFVVSGHAMFTINGDEVDAPAGTFVFVRDPGAKRKAVAKEAGTTVLAAGGPRGEAHELGDWERDAHVLRHWATKDWDAAIAELSELHGEHPDARGTLYNLACAESLAGKSEDALGHLRRALRARREVRRARRGRLRPRRDPRRPGVLSYRRADEHRQPGA